MEKKGGGRETAPTGCYKCGRPGHWSRDCPFSPNSTSSNTSIPPAPSSSSYTKSGSAPKSATPEPPSSENPKKRPPRTRPKLTPELLLSDDGLGYVLRHFPRSFKYHGRGHEVSDLANLIGLYAQWHSHVLPYYSFDQFIHKVEQVGATRRVRMCIRELRERVGRGGDPTKLHEPPVESVAPDCDPVAEDASAADGSVPPTVDPPVEINDVDDLQEQLFDEIYRKATEETSQSLQANIVSTEVQPQKDSEKEPSNEVAIKDGEADSNEILITGEQKSRMEANRLKALEKIQVTEEQKARMEANRLKALEKIASKSRTSTAS